MDDRQQIAKFLLQRFRATLRRDELGPDEPLISNGIIDSFGLLEVLSYLEDTFGVVIDPTLHESTDFETITMMMAVVEKARAAGRR